MKKLGFSFELFQIFLKRIDIFIYNMNDQDYKEVFFVIEMI